MTNVAHSLPEPRDSSERCDFTAKNTTARSSDWPIANHGMPKRPPPTPPPPGRLAQTTTTEGDVGNAVVFVQRAETTWLGQASFYCRVQKPQQERSPNTRSAVLEPVSRTRTSRPPCFIQNNQDRFAPFEHTCLTSLLPGRPFQGDHITPSSSFESHFLAQVWYTLQQAKPPLGPTYDNRVFTAEAFHGYIPGIYSVARGTGSYTKARQYCCWYCTPNTTYLLPSRRFFLV